MNPNDVWFEPGLTSVGFLANPVLSNMRNVLSGALQVVICGV